ncbi:MAG TPA: pyrroline-5-carboxylate reductase [Caulobacteraceae bacterium]
MSGVPAPILIVGAGHMGGALIAGWRRSRILAPGEMILSDPEPGSEALSAHDAGAVLNPAPEVLASAQVVVLAVKPQAWRGVVEAIAPSLGPRAAVISIMAGVAAAPIAAMLGGRAVARVMPNTAAAICQGAAGVFCEDADLRALVHSLFEPLASVVDLGEESLMDVATAVAGSGPAYLYALVEALQGAGAAAGLEPAAAARLASATITGAAALLAQGTAPAEELRRRVTSPGGTTQAALEVLMAPGGFTDLLRRAVDAAVRRSRQLGALA